MSSLPFRPLSVVAALTAALFLAVPASASEKGDPDARFEMRMERLENAVKERLAPRLELDEQTADRLAELLRQSAEEHKRARQKVWAERKALRALVDEGADEAKLDAQLERLQDALEAVPRREVVLEEAKRILTVEQRAQLALMAPKLLGHKLHGHKRHRDKKPGVAEPER